MQRPLIGFVSLEEPVEITTSMNCGEVRKSRYIPRVFMIVERDYAHIGIAHQILSQQVDTMVLMDAKVGFVLVFPRYP